MVSELLEVEAVAEGALLVQAVASEVPIGVVVVLAVGLLQLPAAMEGLH